APTGRPAALFLAFLCTPRKDQNVPRALNCVQTLVEERECPRLDALTGRRVRRRVRIVERAVRGEARRLRLVGIENLEDERLVARHPREPVPAVPRIVRDVIDDAGAILI